MLPGASRRATCGRWCCRRWPGRSSSTSTRPGASIPAAAQKALLHGAPGQVQVRARDGPRTDRVRGRVGRDPPERRAPLSRIVERRDPRASSSSSWSAQPCPTCGGRRLKPESLAVLVAGQEHRRRGGPVGRAAPPTSSTRIPLRAQGASGPGLDPDIAGPILKEVVRPAPLPLRRRPRLPHAGPRRRRRSPAARRSGSAWPPRSAPGWSACSTSSTSRASACTSATTSGCSAR